MKELVVVAFVLLWALAAPGAWAQEEREPPSDPDDKSFILLDDGELLRGKVRFVRSSETSYLRFDGSERVALDSVQAYRTPSRLVKRAADGRLVRLVVNGRVDVYAWAYWHATGPMVIEYDAQGRVTKGGPRHLFYVAEDLATPRRLRYELLRELVSDDPVAAEHLHRYQMLDRVRTGLIVSGLAMTIGSLIRSDLRHGHIRITPLLATGIAVTAASELPRTRQDEHLYDAVDAYNR